MDRALRRYLADKFMQKRWKRLMSWMRPRGAETKEEAQSFQSQKKGLYRKFNGACGCRVCRIKSREHPKYR